MNWILAVFSSVAFLQFLIGIKNASRGETTVSINSAVVAIKIIFYAVVIGFSLYFLRHDLVVQMNWFFVAVSILYGCYTLVSLLVIGKHGKHTRVGPGASAFSAIIDAAVAVGFGYSFFVLTF